MGPMRASSGGVCTKHGPYACVLRRGVHEEARVAGVEVGLGSQDRARAVLVEAEGAQPLREVADPATRGAEAAPSAEEHPTPTAQADFDAGKAHENCKGHEAEIGAGRDEAEGHLQKAEEVVGDPPSSPRGTARWSHAPGARARPLAGSPPACASAATVGGRSGRTTSPSRGLPRSGASGTARGARRLSWLLRGRHPGRVRDLGPGGEQPACDAAPLPPGMLRRGTSRRCNRSGSL